MPQHPCKEVNHSTCQHRNHGGNQTLPYFIRSSALTAGMDGVTPPRGCLEGSASTGVTGSSLKFSSPRAAARVARERPPEKGLTRRAETAPAEAGINLQLTSLSVSGMDGWASRATFVSRRALRARSSCIHTYQDAVAPLCTHLSTVGTVGKGLIQN